MGWCNDEFPGHEGYLVGLIERTPGSSIWRELGWLEADEDLGEITLKRIAVACECGWRSPQVYAPLDTRWSPFIVTMGRGDHDEWARVVWRAHCESLRGIPAGDVVMLRDLATHAQTQTGSPWSATLRTVEGLEREVTALRREVERLASVERAGKPSSSG